MICFFFFCGMVSYFLDKFIKGKSYEEMTKFVLQTKTDYLKEIFGLENGK